MKRIAKVSLVLAVVCLLVCFISVGSPLLMQPNILINGNNIFLWIGYSYFIGMGFLFIWAVVMHKLSQS